MSIKKSGVPRVLFVASSVAFLASNVFASRPEFAYEETDNLGFYLERAIYEEYVYSRSKKTELGDNVEIDAALRYQYSKNTYGRFRFETDPVENRFDNKTSRFELVGGHQYENFAIRVDAEYNTNDNGGSSLGLDLDSRGTYISYRDENGLGATFYPFNLDTEVGKEFNTYDVARLYFIDGAPNAISPIPVDGEKIAVKTIPGIELSYRPVDISGLKFYVGGGVASYLYPGNPNFDIQSSPNATSWKRKEAVGYKLGIHYQPERYALTRFNLQYSGHTKSSETGSLLEAAGSLNGRMMLNRVFLEGEITYSKAGKKPYRVSRTSDWFEIDGTNGNVYQPIYQDLYDRPQDWLGKSDVALAFKVGYEYKEGSIPYIFARYQGKNFIYRERESAHRLRTADESQSHGGLTRIGLGSYKHYGKFTINPEFEWLRAKNPVFANSADFRQDRVTSSFKKQDFLIYLTVSYNFDGTLITK